MLDSEAWALAQRYLLHAEWQNGRSDPEAIQSWRHAQGVLHAIARKRSSAASTGASALSAVAPMLAALDAASRASARIASNPNYIDLSVLPLPAGQPHSFDLRCLDSRTIRDSVNVPPCCSGSDGLSSLRPLVLPSVPLQHQFVKYGTSIAAPAAAGRATSSAASASSSAAAVTRIDISTPNKRFVYGRNTGSRLGNGGGSSNSSSLGETIDCVSEADGRADDESLDDTASRGSSEFMTAREKLRDNRLNNKRLGGGGGGGGGGSSNGGGGGSSSAPRSLGTSGAGIKRKFQSPVRSEADNDVASGKRRRTADAKDEQSGGDEGERNPMFDDERMKNIDPKMAEMILNEIVTTKQTVGWDDIAGLEYAKNSVMEMVVYPLLRPDIYFGIRAPPKGLLLFGPPGTGKTMIGRAIASQADAAFFNISASSLTSKWVGEGEKMVRALFTVARCHESKRKIIFIDEIDSLLTQRTDGDQECSRRLKTEFLVQMEGVGSDNEDCILVVGATNRPQELDEAARRRFVKRLYIPLPEAEARKNMVRIYLAGQRFELSDADLDVIAHKTRGYSGSDMKALCSEAARCPVRSIKNIMEVAADAVRPINLTDFEMSLSVVRASVSNQDLELYLEWNRQFGSTPAQ